MSKFNCAVKTIKNVEDGINYHTVMAWGTKKFCVEFAEKIFDISETVSVKVTREKDGKVVFSLTR